MNHNRHPSSASQTNLLWGLAYILFMMGCVSVTPTQDSGVTPVIQEGPATIIGEQNRQPCTSPHSSLRSGNPVYIDGSGLFVTDFSNKCGRRNIESDSHFSVMGLPCSGGEGALDYRGERRKASLVRFHMDVGCAMKNADPQTAGSIVRNSLGLGQNAKPSAVSAMSVQLWEVPMFGDLGVGEDVSLRTVSGVRYFPEMDESKPLRVKLYGKENSWVATNEWYEMEADIFVTGSNKFRTTLVRARRLEKRDLKDLKDRCERSQSAAACSSVLAGGMRH